MYIPHFFIHLDCFYVLAIVNNSANNMKVQISNRNVGFDSFVMYLHVRLLDYMAVLFFKDPHTVFPAH